MAEFEKPELNPGLNFASLRLCVNTGANPFWSPFSRKAAETQRTRIGQPSFGFKSRLSFTPKASKLLKLLRKPYVMTTGGSLYQYVYP